MGPGTAFALKGIPRGFLRDPKKVSPFATLSDVSFGTDEDYQVFGNRVKDHPHHEKSAAYTFVDERPDRPHVSLP